MSRLDVTVGLRNAAFRTGLEQTRNMARDFSNRLRGMFSGIGGLLGAGSFLVMAKGAIDAGSRISDMATQLRIGIEELQALQFASRQAGVSSQTLERALLNVQQRSMEAANGNARYSEALQRLGIDVEKFLALPQERKLEEIARAQARATDQNQAFNDVATLLGQRAGPQLTEVLDRLAREGFPAVADQAREAGQVMSEDTVTALDRASDEIEMFKNRITVAMGNILVDFRTEEGLLKLLFNLLAIAGRFGGAVIDAIVMIAKFAWATLKTPFEYAVEVLSTGLAAVVQRLKVGLLDMLNSWIERINRIPGISIETRDVEKAREVLREINAEAAKARETSIGDILNRNIAGIQDTNFSSDFESYWKDLAGEMEDAQRLRQAEERAGQGASRPQVEMARQAMDVEQAEEVSRELLRAREMEAKVDERNLLARMNQEERNAYLRERQAQLFAEAETAMADGDELTAIQKRTEAKRLESQIREEEDSAPLSNPAEPTLTVDSLQRIGGGGGLGSVSDPAQRERERQTQLLERIASAVENAPRQSSNNSTLAP